MVGKYVTAKRCPLYLAFMNLSTAFDRVSRPALWSALIDMGLDGALVNFLFCMHNGMNAAVRCGPSGELTDNFELTRGVRQGCVLAPLLFILYINNLSDRLKNATVDVPIMGRSQFASASLCG